MFCYILFHFFEKRLRKLLERTCWPSSTETGLKPRRTEMTPRYRVSEMIWWMFWSDNHWFLVSCQVWRRSWRVWPEMWVLSPSPGTSLLSKRSFSLFSIFFHFLFFLFLLGPDCRPDIHHETKVSKVCSFSTLAWHVMSVFSYWTQSI